MGIFSKFGQVGEKTEMKIRLIYVHVLCYAS